jgi:Ca-activated chloride channel family protein
MSPENRKAALAYLHNLRPQGATNIEGALNSSLKMVDSKVPSYLLFLTDGEATQGMAGEIELAKLAVDKNTQEARIFSFGVGDQVNSRLLDRLSGNSGGVTVYVKQEENIEAKVGTFFQKLTSPVLTKPVLSTDLATNRLIPQKMADIFQEGQTVVVGRYPAGGQAKFNLTGLVGDKKTDFSFSGELSSEPNPNGDFVEQLWAQRRIGEIIDYLDMNTNEKTGPNKELVDELVVLSKKYGILTPYTSFLALEKTSLTDRDNNNRLAGRNLEIIDSTVGGSANIQRELKQGFMAARPAMPAPGADKRMAQENMEAMASLDLTASEAGTDQLQLPQNMGGKAFFLKQGQLMDGSLTEADLKNVEVIEQFSERYFVLAQMLSPDQSVWLSQNQPVMFKFQSNVYLIKPPSNG